ncbi:uncharacterized protein LOC129245073 [Anastrepha obliqua]|uniref:uncharacterized protein LOC129245073 n=1 Tax=Anastrepha obliqua TaxID=95512 RepID=UPI00240A25D0|nr:uncharacterized protein LOC129245073 [Anastrepha obliqua]
MESKPQTQQPMQQNEEQQLQQQQETEQSESMNAVTDDNMGNVYQSTVDEATYMCMQEECEQVSVDADADANADVNTETQQHFNYQQEQNHHSHQQYNPKKSVSFKTLVDIFQLSDAWQLNVKKSNLKTEEDQAKRRIVQRNY